MVNFISVIIPNYNGSATIKKCLEAAFSSKYENFEIVVVDDCSKDNSVEIIKGFPCKLICLDKHSGASKARNIGARNSHGEVFFFTDADCLLREDALSIAGETLAEKGTNVIIGGTYTPIPYDKRFLSLFQSVFIHFSETKRTDNPDYIATHAMIMKARTFRKNGGFAKDFLPVLEDVEFSHRLRRSGYRLIMNPDILVRHIFNYSLLDSLRNAMKKSMYWTMYSIKNKDLLTDSGAASVELKTNAVSQMITLTLLALWVFSQKAFFAHLLFPIIIINIFINRKLIKAFYGAKGIIFALFAFLYYSAIYPFGVGVGALAGIMKYYFLGSSKGIH